MDIAVHEEINTPQTLGSIPRYVLLHNAISRSAHSLSAPAQKLTLMAMALLPPDLSSLKAAFTFPEYCEALETEKGGRQYEIFQKAVDECMKCVIMIETGCNKKGKPSWEKFHWFIKSHFNSVTGQAEMEFSPTLAAFLIASKWVYSKINLTDVGQLQSRYAIKLFEMAISYMSLKGKDGNKYERWYFQRTVEELRLILNVPEDAYKTIKDFRKYVVENPINEINDAAIGVKITPTG